MPIVCSVRKRALRHQSNSATSLWSSIRRERRGGCCRGRGAGRRCRRRRAWIFGLRAPVVVDVADPRATARARRSLGAEGRARAHIGINTPYARNRVAGRIGRIAEISNPLTRAATSAGEATATDRRCRDILLARDAEPDDVATLRARTIGVRPAGPSASRAQTGAAGEASGRQIHEATADGGITDGQGARLEDQVGRQAAHRLSARERHGDQALGPVGGQARIEGDLGSRERRSVQEENRSGGPNAGRPRQCCYQS